VRRVPRLVVRSDYWTGMAQCGVEHYVAKPGLWASVHCKRVYCAPESIPHVLRTDTPVPPLQIMYRAPLFETPRFGSSRFEPVRRSHLFGSLHLGPCLLRRPGERMARSTPCALAVRGIASFTSKTRTKKFCRKLEGLKFETARKL
jgi:hypothetical protein